MFAAKDTAFWLPVTMEKVLIQMALQLGGMAALSLVLDHPDGKSDWGIPLDIYSRYTRAEEILAEQATVVHNMVVALDSYLW